MMKPFLTSVFSLVIFFTVAQVKSPNEFLGYELGDRFTRHHQVVGYFKHVAESSPLVIMEKYGETYEKRPLYVFFISSPENLSKLETIRTDNLKRTGIESGIPEMNVSIVWFSYNVHGNESVSTEASMATIYELITNRTDWLKNTLVVIDPCINPDGRERYVNFYWEHVNTPFNPDPNSWEHHEPWPGGRANHYLFDLNRDWAWQTQIETQQRIAVYNKWLPQVHVDFHEQGINSPYYFAPAAEPFHELITDWQRDFQTQIGKNHARYFDENNWFYFTKQYFDLLYPGYGDTYPAYNGAIGMTYEQGGAGQAGLGIIKQEEDTLTLKDRITHHYITGISTVEITARNSQKVLDEFKKFFSQSASSKYKSYVLKYDGNVDKFNRLKMWLDVQGIKYGSAGGVRGSGYNYRTKRNESFSVDSKDLIINTDQPKSVLTSVLFEPQTKLMDSLTYDITAWAVPYAFGIEAYATTSMISLSGKSELTTFQPDQLDEAYGYIFKWNSMRDAQFLAALLKEGIKVRYTTRPLSITGSVFERGSFMVTKRDNNISDFSKNIAQKANEFERQATPIPSGFVTSGPDIGSSDIHYLKAPKVALIGGEGTSSLDFGATWHYFEQNLHYPVTTISTDYFESVDLDEYDVIIMQNGWYNGFGDKKMGKINDWVSSGGTLIAVQGALKKFADEKGELMMYNSDDEKSKFEKVDEEIKEGLQLIPKAEEDRYQIREYVAGAIFSVRMDNTHPLAFGYGDTYYSLKTSSQRYGYLPGSNVGVIASGNDHLSGFVGQLVLDRVGKSLVFGVQYKRRGQIVYMVDNPLFRSFWENGKLLFANAIFYVGN